MTGKEDNVGFLTTGSRVEQFRLSLWGCLVPRCLCFTATPARPASLPSSRVPQAYEVRAGSIGREKRVDSRAARIGDKQEHALPTSRRGLARRFGGLNMKEFSIRKNGWRTAGALLLALLPFCAAPYAQDSSPVHYVNVSNTTPVAPFTNWETAAIHIQDAILFANNGDTVVVTNGAYNERIDFMGKAIVVSSEEGPSATIIDGNQSGSVVSFSGGEGTNSIIQGFTITNGYATQGGGIYCTNASPGISNCVIDRKSTI